MTKNDLLITNILNLKDTRARIRGQTLQMLDWYEDSFDDDGEPIYDDDDDEYDDDLCSWCDNEAALDCDYGDCGACCDESDCERHGWD